MITTVLTASICYSMLQKNCENCSQMYLEQATRQVDSPNFLPQEVNQSSTFQKGGKVRRNKVRTDNQSRNYRPQSENVLQKPLQKLSILPSFSGSEPATLWSMQMCSLDDHRVRLPHRRHTSAWTGYFSNNLHQKIEFGKFQNLPRAACKS